MTVIIVQRTTLQRVQRLWWIVGDSEVYRIPTSVGENVWSTSGLHVLREWTKDQSAYVHPASDWRYVFCGPR